MHVYDNVFAQGLHVHLSMTDAGTGYIIVRDIYTGDITMRWFSQYQDVVIWLQRLQVSRLN